MLIIFSELQRSHKPAYIIREGKRYSSYDVPERIDSILSAIHADGIGQVVSPDNAGIDPIRAVHNNGMIQFLENAYARHLDEGQDSVPVFPAYFPPPGQRRQPVCFEGQKGFYCIDMEVPIDEHTWAVALVSAYCAWTGAMHLRSGENNVYALCRPPGHHAGPDFMGGYCYLNNAAIAAQSLSQDGEKIAIMDIDYHHGNGTQAIFYENPGIFYGSLHIDPSMAYPFFAGYADETGKGSGEGTNRNMPLPEGSSENQYLSALDSLIEHIMAFNPRWLVVSAGFDTYIHDPIGTFQVTTPGFYQAGRRIQSIGKPALIVQEGGYSVPDLGKNVVAFLEGLSS